MINREGTCLHILLILWVTPVFAQSTIDFKVGYKKGHSYSQVLDNRTHTVATYGGNPVRIAELKSKGMKNPSVSDKQFQLTCKTQCFSTIANGREIMDMRFSKATGNALRIPKNYMAPVHLHKYPGKQPIIDSVSTRMTPADFKTQWGPMVQSILGQMSYPTRKINVGGSMKENVIQPLPIGGKTYNVLVVTTYTLKKATADSAWFDIAQTFSLKNPVKDSKTLVKGTGTGKMVYCIKNQYIAHREMTSDMSVMIIQGNINVESVEQNNLHESINMDK